MDRATKALEEGVPDGMPKTYSALAAHSEVPLSTLHHRKAGRRSREAKAQSQRYLYDYEEDAVVDFVLHMGALGQPVRMKYIAAIAYSATRHRPAADRPSKPPGVNWAKALEKRRPEIVAVKSRPQEWNRYTIYDKAVRWFEMIEKEIRNPAILPENVYNMDETGVMLSMPGSIKVLVGKNERGSRGYRGARVKRTMVTAIECISADGRCLNPMVIWPASTHRANWTTYPTPGWFYACSDTGFSDSYISLQWLKRVFDPQTKQRANGKPRMLIWDGFGTHDTLEILEFCFENNIILCRLPSHTSHKLQPCDVAAFNPLKTAYREQVERMERGGINAIGKQHFTYLYSPARVKALTKRNILAAWRGSGLFPFNPDRVLAEIPKPPPELTIPSTNDTSTEYLGQEALLTPTTPTTAEGLNLLLRQIEQSPNDKASIQRKERLQKKVNKAALKSLANTALLKVQNKFLTKMNNEGQKRRSAKSTILMKGKGEGRVAQYEDLEKARAERDAKDASKAAKDASKAAKNASKAAKTAKAAQKTARAAKDAADKASPATNANSTVAEPSQGQKKRGRKRKFAVTDTDPDPHDNTEPRSKASKGEAGVKETTVVSESYVVPTARMYDKAIE